MCELLEAPHGEDNSKDINNKAFTLVELSIVLIIIGLIVGGVLGGQSLIRSAELQSIVNDINKYRTAVNAFRLEFNALPGDMDNAQDYWPTCVDNGANLCNGNGDGIVSWSGVGSREDLRGWQHMSLAGIVPGRYTGEVENVDGNDVLVGGINVPDLQQVGSVIWYQRVGITGVGQYGTLNAIVNFQIGAPNPTESFRLYSAFTPKDARAIDTKADDGLPALGDLQGDDGSEIWLGGDATNSTCVNYDDVTGGNLEAVVDGTGNAGDVKYSLAETSKVCRLMYRVIGS